MEEDMGACVSAAAALALSRPQEPKEKAESVTLRSKLTDVFGAPVASGMI
jgi:hypothetical protein